MIGSLLHKSLGPNGRGYELITANYFAQIKSSSEAVRICRSSYSEARDKLSWEAFAFLLDRTIVESDRWLGHRVRAVDGSCIQIPRSAEILEQFPIQGNHFGATHYPSLALVVAADVFSCQPTHTIVGNKPIAEREALKSLLNCFEKDDISILDRGLDGKKVWRAFADQKQYFLGRLRTNGRAVLPINRIVKDQTIQVEEDLRLRVIKGPRLKNGDFVYLVTNLTNSRKYSRQELLKLYKMRQAVEDVFLNLKNTLKVKNIRSKKVNGVLQEIYAALTMTSIVAGLRYQYEKLKTGWRVSFKALAWRLETAFSVLSTTVIERQVESIFNNITEFGHRPQPGRAYPRYSRQPTNKWNMEKRRK